MGPSAPQQPTWKDHINCWIFFNKSSKNSHIFLDERQSVCTGTIVRGHDQASQRPLQDGLNSRVHGTVGQHESRSNHAEDEGEDLRSNKLKQFGVKLILEKTPKTTAAILTTNRVVEFSMRALQQPRNDVTITTIDIPIRM